MSYIYIYIISFQLSLNALSMMYAVRALPLITMVCQIWVVWQQPVVLLVSLRLGHVELHIY